MNSVTDALAGGLPPISAVAALGTAARGLVDVPPSDLAAAFLDPTAGWSRSVRFMEQALRGQTPAIPGAISSA